MDVLLLDIVKHIDNLIWSFFFID